MVGGSQLAAQHEPAEIGWLRAHVRIGDSYPLVAVRVTRRAADGGGLVAALDSEHESVLSTAAYAVDVARALYEAGTSVGSLEVEASLRGEPGAVALDLRVVGDGLDEAGVVEAARAVQRRWVADGKWRFGETSAIRALVVLVEPAVRVRATEPVVPESAAGPDFVEEAEAPVPAAPVNASAGRRPIAYAIVVAVVLVGVVVSGAVISASQPTPPGAPRTVEVAGATQQVAAAQAASAATAANVPVVAQATAAAAGTAGAAEASRPEGGAQQTPGVAAEPGPLQTVALAQETATAVGTDANSGAAVAAEPASAATAAVGTNVPVAQPTATIDAGGGAAPVAVANQPAAEATVAANAASEATAAAVVASNVPVAQPTAGAAVADGAAATAEAAAQSGTAQPVSGGPPASGTASASAATAPAAVAQATVSAATATATGVGADVNAASATAATVPTSVPVAQPTLSGTPGAAAAVSNVLLEFAPGREAGLIWPNDPRGVAWFDPDGYHLAARRPSQFVALDLLGDPAAAAGLEVTATFHKVGGPSGGGYGIVLGDQQTPGALDGSNQLGQFFVFEVGDKGEVGAWRRDNDRWVELLPWTASSAVHPGLAENVLQVRIGADGQVAFTVNGTSIALPNAAAVQPGGVGLYLGGDGNEAVLSRFTLARLN